MKLKNFLEEIKLLTGDDQEKDIEVTINGTEKISLSYTVKKKQNEIAQTLEILSIRKPTYRSMDDR